jgi:hypothetical protein
MANEYEDVAASQTAQALGDGGTGRGQHISHLIVIPATTSPGAVALLDDSSSLTVFAGGATSVSNLVPFTIFLGCDSKNGPWKITTGANVAVRAVGDFN